jgi:hypothetical protein
MVFAILVGWLMASGAVAQELLPVQVNVEKKEAVSRVVKKQATVKREKGRQWYTPEVAERTQKVSLTIKVTNMSPAPLSEAMVNYTIVAKGRTASDLKIAAEGKKQVDLPVMRPVSVEPEALSFLTEETTWTSALASKNTKDGEQYYGIHVVVEHGNRNFVFAEPRDLTEALKRLKPPAADAVAPAASATTQARNAYLNEKPFDNLSDKTLTKWGQTALATSPRWKHGETEHFVIHFFANADPIARRCEKFYTDIQEFFGNRADRLQGRKSHVFAFYDAADWKNFKRQVKLPDWSGGVTHGNEFFYPSTGADRQFDQRSQTQAHEMTHLVFNRFFTGRVPSWLNEGVAEYFGVKKTSDITAFRSHVSRAKPMDLYTLFTAEKYPEKDAEVHSFYAEAAIVVDFLTQTSERRALLPKFIDAMIASNNVDAALKIYGFPTRADFQKAYDRHRALFPKS